MRPKRKDFSPSSRTEAKTIARIVHPNIVHVYDFGVSVMPSGVRAAWMALEWLTGETFESTLLARRGRGGRAPAACLAILKPVLDALAIVHAAGIAHRDLKPANIMLTPSSAGGATLKLLDFGIAKIMEAEEGPGTKTRSSYVAFSPGYAAPEQISSGRSGPWTDVHAVGLIMTEMLIDRAPFEAESRELLVQQIVDRVRPSPAKFGVSVGAWETILCRALAVSPAERYRDAGEMLRALEASVAVASAAYRPASTTGPTIIGSPPPRSPTTTTGAISEPRMRGARATTRTTLFVIGAVALAVLGVSGWRALAPPSMQHGSTIVDGSSTTMELSAPRAPAALASVDAATNVAPFAAVTPSSSPAVSPSPSAHAPPGRRVSAPRATSIASAVPSATAAPAVSASCNPPYVIDSAGHRQFKSECL